MAKNLSAHFDGKVIVPDEPLQLPVGTPLRVQVEIVSGAPAAEAGEPQADAPSTSPRFAAFLELAVDLPDAPADLGLQHDHYLYGTPKR